MFTTSVNEREEDLKEPSIATLGLFGQTSNDRKSCSKGEKMAKKTRTPFQRRGTTERGSLAGHIDKEMEAWSSNNVHSLTTLSSWGNICQVTTATSRPTYTTTPSLSHQLHIHRCDLTITPVDPS